MTTLLQPEQQSALRAIAHAKTAILRAERAFLRNQQSRVYLVQRLNDITKWVGIVRALLRDNH